MLENSAYGPSPRLRRSGSMLTHTLMAVVGLPSRQACSRAFYNPTSALPAPGARSAPPTGGEQAVVTNVKPGW